MTAVTTLADLLHQLSTVNEPRLTWYGEERIELSGRVLANWVTKTTNLLIEEYDVGPGFQIALDLPVHWRAIVWALATWRTGATVSLAGDGDILVTTHPELARPGAEVIAVALPALARTFPGPLPPGAADAAAAVMTYGDQLGQVPAVDPAATALISTDFDPQHADLDARCAPTGGRTLLDARRGLAVILLDALATWRAGASVVIVDVPLATALDSDPDRLAHLLATERVAITDAGPAHTA